MQKAESELMSPEQFDVICEHYTRQSTLAQKAARAILVDGAKNSDIAKEYSHVMTRQALSRIRLHLLRCYDAVREHYPYLSDGVLTEKRARFICKLCKFNDRTTDAYCKALIEGAPVDQCAADAKVYVVFFQERMSQIVSIHADFVRHFANSQ